jgi:hypothetical protein
MVILLRISGHEDTFPISQFPMGGGDNIARNGFRCVITTPDYTLIDICPKLLGGKGGFGALLKRQKNIGKRTTNFDSTRDSEGRRLRDANRDERAERVKEEREEKDVIVDSLKNGISREPSVSIHILDDKYLKQLEQSKRKTVDSLKEGLFAQTSLRPTLAAPAPPVKRRRIMGDESSDSD